MKKWIKDLKKEIKPGNRFVWLWMGRDTILKLIAEIEQQDEEIINLMMDYRLTCRIAQEKFTEIEKEVKKYKKEK